VSVQDFPSKYSRQCVSTMLKSSSLASASLSSTNSQKAGQLMSAVAWMKVYRPGLRPATWYMKYIEQMVRTFSFDILFYPSHFSASDLLEIY